MAITFPVSSDARFVAYRISTGEILRKDMKWPNKAGLPVTFDPDIAAAIIVNVPAPAFDPATEKLEKQETLDAPNEQYLVSFLAVALSQSELDAYAEQQDLQQKRTQLINAINTLRQWSTEAQAVTVTSGNAVNVLQNLIDKQATFYSRFADLLETQSKGVPLSP